MKKIALIFLGVLIGLVLAELAVRLFGPAQSGSRKTPAYFVMFEDQERGSIVSHVIAPNSEIRFTYPSNPRGYFDQGGGVVHRTNGYGFRGPQFPIEKPKGSTRVLVFGDSFTFGEGVKDEHVFTRKMQDLLAEHGDSHYEIVNLGVGGYNIEDYASLFKNRRELFKPDAAIFVLTPNDAEEKLFLRNKEGRWHRRERGQVEEMVQFQASKLASYSRLIGLIEGLRARNQRTRALIDHYSSLFQEGTQSRKRFHQSLLNIGTQCKLAAIHCFGVVFPLLWELDQYPFQEEYTAMLWEVAGAGLQPIGLLDSLSEQRAEDLWVHPVDQHPNERAHAIVARVLASALIDAQIRPLVD